tara:strand:+ start:309 stop:1565 length:1257 start_codon:yes stop_codon:yes gene_type:complete
MYNYIIIGGGISGLNTADKLKKKYPKCSILLIEAKSFFGGRIYTVNNEKYNFLYDSGAARFHNHQKNLFELIKKYNLKTFELPSNDNVDYYNVCSGNDSVVKIPQPFKYLDTNIKKLIKESKKYSKKDLQKHTLKSFSIKHLGKNITQQLIHMFGYTSEFESFNCYDALNTFSEEFKFNQKFFVLQKGLSELVKNMVKTLKKNKVILKLSTKVENVSFKNNIYHLNTRDKTYSCEKIIFCIKPTQLMEIPLFKPIKSKLNCIQPIPLLRIYAAYKPNKNKEIWFKDLSRFTTNHPIRHFIPIDINSGLTMVSYTDGNDAIFLIGKHYDGTLKKYIHDELKKIFVDKEINNPYYFSVEFWDEGIHYWRKNSDSDILSHDLLYPMRQKYPNLYLCGEAFSQKQAWIEGALISSNKLIKLL